jgi:hypothetical protein
MCMSCACGMCMWHVLVMFMFMCMCMCMWHVACGMCMCMHVHVACVYVCVCISTAQELSLLNRAVCSEVDPRRGSLTEQQVVLLHNRRASLRAEASGSPQGLLTPARPADWRWQYEGTTSTTSAAIDHPDAEQLLEQLLVSMQQRRALSCLRVSPCQQPAHA